MTALSPRLIIVMKWLQSLKLDNYKRQLIHTAGFPTFKHRLSTIGLSDL